MTGPDATALRRLLLALDASRGALDAVPAAAALAARLGARLEALLVEDEDLLRAAALPLAGQVRLPSGDPAPLDEADVRAGLRALAARAREALAEAAGPLRVEWRLEVARGRVPALALAAGGDLLVLGRRGRPAPRGRPLLLVEEPSPAGRRAAALAQLLSEAGLGRVSPLRASGRAALVRAARAEPDAVLVLAWESPLLAGAGLARLLDEVDAPLLLAR